MPGKTRKQKISKRVQDMWADPDSVWGKNPALEEFWRSLASGEKVVVITKDKQHKHVKLPNLKTQKYRKIFDEFDADPNIIAVLSSNMSQDSYELYLYPKAKGKTVEQVIASYKKYFKSLGDDTFMKKVLVPM
jgi:hypothetical protein